ncbi:MAG: hypothetical protein EA352_01995 [Gemmatimonadales bacterium]|nr:MAG: hypothetical protein EA352_01995 [Gemmatimonadales bacterium]
MLACLLAMASGCGAGADEPGPSGALFPEGVPVRAATVVLEVGEDEGLLLSSVGGLLRTEAGELLAPDLQQGLIHVIHGESGELLGHFGQRAEGPGQVVSPRALGEDAQGRVWVRHQLGATVFERDGARGDYRPAGRATSTFQSPNRVVRHLSPLVSEGDGVLAPIIMYETRGPEGRDSFTAFGMVRLALLEGDPDGSATLAWELAPVPDSVVPGVDVIQTDTRRRLTRAPAIGSEQVMRAVASDGRVAESTGQSYKVQFYSRTGGFVESLEAPDPPVVPLSEAEQESHRELFPFRDDPAAPVTAVNYFMPDAKQPLQQLAFDRLNRLWVRLAVPDGSSVKVAHVFNQAGELEEVVVWPSEVSLFGRPLLPHHSVDQDMGWGVSHDEFQVPTLVKVEFNPISAEERARLDDGLSIPK